MNKTVELRNGAQMPLVGLGTWKAPPEKTRESVITAVKAGYRLIDCANDYDNEHVIGEALQELFRVFFNSCKLVELESLQLISCF